MGVRGTIPSECVPTHTIYQRFFSPSNDIAVHDGMHTCDVTHAEDNKTFGAVVVHKFRMHEWPNWALYCVQSTDGPLCDLAVVARHKDAQKLQACLRCGLGHRRANITSKAPVIDYWWQRVHILRASSCIPIPIRVHHMQLPSTRRSSE